MNLIWKMKRCYIIESYNSDKREDKKNVIIIYNNDDSSSKCSKGRYSLYCIV